MKKLLLIAVVAALALTLVPLAVAGGSGHGGWKHGKAKFELVGKVTVVDATARTVTIMVKSGTKTVRAFRGHEATMGFTPTAKIWLLTDPEATAIDVGDVPLGAKVKVRGVIDRSQGPGRVHHQEPQGASAAGRGARADALRGRMRGGRTARMANDRTPEGRPARGPPLRRSVTREAVAPPASVKLAWFR